MPETREILTEAPSIAAALQNVADELKRQNDNLVRRHRWAVAFTVLAAVFMGLLSYSTITNRHVLHKVQEVTSEENTARYRELTTLQIQDAVCQLAHSFHDANPGIPLPPKCAPIKAPQP